MLAVDFLGVIMSEIEKKILRDVLVLARDYFLNSSSETSVAIPFEEESFAILKDIWQRSYEQPNELSPEICWEIIFIMVIKLEDYDGDGERRMYIDFDELADYFIERLESEL